MAEQLARPKDQVEVYWFSEQAQGYVTDGALEQFESGRLGFPNSILILIKHMSYTANIMINMP